MFFKDIAGQEKVKEKLLNTYNGKRISHALLFAGPEGNGKLSLAIAYAQFLSCENKQVNDSCGECPSCKKYNKLIHPDLHFVFPVVKSKSFSKPVSDDYIKNWREFILGNKYHSFNKWLEFLGVGNQQAGIFSQESHEVIKKLNFKTYESEYKVMIVWMPEKMNITASNKLLKILEEPPEKTLFILVSENPDDILKTILSRTQFVKIPKIYDSALFDKLKELYNFTDDKTNEIVRLSDGSFLRAEEIIADGNENLNNNFELFGQMMRYCFSDKMIDIIDWTDQISKLGREKQKEFLVYSLRMIRENFILNVSENSENNIVFLANNERDFSNKFKQFIHTHNIESLITQFTNAAKNIERNGYDRLVFLDLAIKTAKLLKFKPQ
jgi:DNA polymerase-3 subunit delta'